MKKTIKITITDNEGTLLDTLTLEIDSTCREIGVRALPMGMASRNDEEVLVIGQ